jgi:hypothetical protein
VLIAVAWARCWPKKSFMLRPGTIDILIGPPIASTGRWLEELTREMDAWIEGEMRCGKSIPRRMRRHLRLLLLPLLRSRASMTKDGNAALCRALHSAAYAQVATMRIGGQWLHEFSYEDDPQGLELLRIVFGAMIDRVTRCQRLLISYMTRGARSLRDCSST